MQHELYFAGVQCKKPALLTRGFHHSSRRQRCKGGLITIGNVHVNIDSIAGARPSYANTDAN